MRTRVVGKCPVALADAKRSEADIHHFTSFYRRPLLANAANRRFRPIPASYIGNIAGPESGCLLTLVNFAIRMTAFHGPRRRYQGAVAMGHETSVNGKSECCRGFSIIPGHDELKYLPLRRIESRSITPRRIARSTGVRGSATHYSMNALDDCVQRDPYCMSGIESRLVDGECDALSLNRGSLARATTGAISMMARWDIYTAANACSS